MILLHRYEIQCTRTEINYCKKRSLHELPFQETEIVEIVKTKKSLIL